MLSANIASSSLLKFSFVASDNDSGQMVTAGNGILCIGVVFVANVTIIGDALYWLYMVRMM